MRVMTLGKNFRLPTDVRPLRYSVHLAPDLKAGSFEGRMELEIQLDRPRGELQLHALGLAVGRARARGLAKATAEPDAESETVTLKFERELPAGRALLELAWSGKFSPGLRGLYRAGPLAGTPFEGADGRGRFPCFDEPAVKARVSGQLFGPAGGGAA